MPDSESGRLISQITVQRSKADGSLRSWRKDPFLAYDVREHERFRLFRCSVRYRGEGIHAGTGRAAPETVS